MNIVITSGEIITFAIGGAIFILGLIVAYFIGKNEGLLGKK